MRAAPPRAPWGAAGTTSTPCSTSCCSAAPRSRARWTARASSPWPGAPSATTTASATCSTACATCTGDPSAGRRAWAARWPRRCWTVPSTCGWATSSAWPRGPGAERTVSGKQPAPRPLVSVIAPVFNEEAVIDEFVVRLGAVLDGLRDRYDSEIVLVDDGSRDGSLAHMKALAEKDRRLRVLELRRNYGQTAAL